MTDDERYRAAYERTLAGSVERLGRELRELWRLVLEAFHR